MIILKIVFIMTAIVTLGSAVMVVASRHVIHAALSLVLTLAGVAVLFATLEAIYFVVVQVMVYIGAIAILIIFVVMLTRQVMEDDGPPLNKNWWIAALSAVGLFIVLTASLMSWHNFNQQRGELPAGSMDIAEIGQALVSPSGFVIPFEVASVLLLAALIGAIYLTVDQNGGN